MEVLKNVDLEQFKFRRPTKLHHITETVKALAPGDAVKVTKEDYHGKTPLKFRLGGIFNSRHKRTIGFRSLEDGGLIVMKLM